VRHVRCSEKIQNIGQRREEATWGNIGLDGRITLKRILKIIAWECM
jgi:hypothetical protein